MQQSNKVIWECWVHKVKRYESDNLTRVSVWGNESSSLKPSFFQNTAASVQTVGVPNSPQQQLKPPPIATTLSK